MNPKLTRTLYALWLALALAGSPLLRAQDTPATPPTSATPATPATPATADDKVTPPPAAEQPAAPETVEEPAAAPAEPAEEAPAPAEMQPADAPLRELGADKEPVSTEPEKPAVKGKKPKHIRTIGYDSKRNHNSSNERVSVMHDSTLAAGEKAEAVVSIFGSSTSAGEVSDAVVSVIGSSTSSGNVGGAVVSVIGNTRVTGGTVGDTSVAVLGSNYINAHIKGEVVAVLGNVDLGPDAVVDGDLICIGGTVTRDAKATVRGDVQNIAIGGHHFNFDGLHAWFKECFLYARPLAFGAHLGWAWLIAGMCLAFYALLALIAPEGVNKCVQTLEDRPGKSILAGFLTLLLTPVAYLLLVLTLALVIGVVLIPLFSLGLFFAAIFGKVVMLAWLGRRVTKPFGDGALAHPFFAVLIGGVIVMGLYTVPVLGFVVYKLLAILGLGVVVYTLLLAYRSSRPVPVKRGPASGATPAAGDTTAVPPVLGAMAPAPEVVASLPPVISASTLDRAGFWIRLGASLLDACMVGIAFGMLHKIWYGFGGIFPFWFAVYCISMWATKGTTIGGIICGLKVVRLDDRPVDWGVAVVRGLTAFLSLAVAGLGFVWVAFDPEKQSWHDKVAGTTVVRVPKGTPLL
jgi:uncharacterized RDD family membrane protein YckC